MSNKTIEIFNNVLQSESNTIKQNIGVNDHVIEQVVQTILNRQGKLVFSGIGKSSIVAQKIVATMNSTGTPSVYLHATEAFHGDLGICEPQDILIVLSKSGTTTEIVQLTSYLRSKGNIIIGILGNRNCPLSELCHYVVDAYVPEEADTLNLAPTNSSTLFMSIGDAIAVCLMYYKKFTAENFAAFHPGGQLGINLMHTVEEHMNKLEKVATVYENTAMKNVLVQMTEKPLGAACVINEQNELIGIITDGDIRRFFVKNDEIANTSAKDIMIKNPFFIGSKQKIMDAIDLMENRNSKISVLPVIDSKKLVGLIRIHDCY